MTNRQQQWLINHLNTRTIDPRKQAAVERRERHGARHVTVAAPHQSPVTNHQATKP